MATEERKPEDIQKEDIQKDGGKQKPGKKKFKKKKKKGGNNNKPPKQGTFNDPSWYTVDPSISKQVASFPFNVFIDREFTIANTENQMIKNTGQTKAKLPGVMVYKYIPLLNTNTPNNAVEITSRALYQFVRHTNSGAKNYEAVDMMMYIMAMDSVYLMLHQTRRILRLINTYLLKNKAIPRSILEGLGMTWDDAIGKNFANWVARFNILVSRTNSFAVPAEFNLFKRRAAMGLLTFTDEATEVTQITIPHTDVAYIFDAAKFTTGGALIGFDIFRDTIALGAGGRPAISRARTNITSSTSTSIFKAPNWTLDTVLDNITRMLDVITFDEDMNIIAGDLMKAYGDNVHKLTHMEWNETQDFTHDPDFLKQFETATVLDLPGGFAFGKSNETAQQSALSWVIPSSSTSNEDNCYPTICQIEGILVNSPYIDNNKTAQAGSDYWKISGNIVVGQNVITHRLLSVDAEPTPEKVIEWTRLMTIVDEDWKVISGVELGLGFFALYTPPLPNGFTAASLIQWFQTAAEDTTNIASNATTLQGGISYESYQGTSGSNTFVQFRNRPEAWSTIESMNSAPRKYPINRFILKGGVDKHEVVFRPFMTNVKAKSTWLSNQNVLILHDMAIYGLLAIPIMKK